MNSPPNGGAAMDAWLDRHPGAEAAFEPIQWSAAPARASRMLRWLQANEAEWSASPLASAFADVLARVTDALADPQR